jgi:hypothetical protein
MQQPFNKLIVFKSCNLMHNVELTGRGTSREEGETGQSTMGKMA